MTYKFLEQDLSCEQELNGEVTDIATSEYFQMKISLFDSVYSMGTTNTDQKGMYSFPVECGETYYVRTAVHCQRRKITIDKEKRKNKFTDKALEKKKNNVRWLWVMI
jgi:hypothetical protein